VTESTLPTGSLLAAIITEARRRGRRRKVALATGGVLALLLGGAIWAGLALSGGGGAATVHAQPGFHVVPAHGPVAHQLLETWTFFQPLSVDLTTGNQRPVRTTTETWYDSRGDAIRVVSRVDGRIQSDHSDACPHTRRPSPCWPGFSFQNYWPLDASRYTRETGIGTFHGRPLDWIAPRQPGGFAAYPGGGEQIGLDPHTHEPVADRMYSDGKVITETQVLERKPVIPPDEYAFVVPNRTSALRQDPTPFSVRSADPLAVRAHRGLGRRPLWLGERFHGNRLRTVTIGSTFDPPTGIRPKAVPYVQYDYGDVVVTQYSSRSLYGPAQRGPLPGRVTLVKSQTGKGTSPTPIRGLELTRNGLFVMASTSHVLDRAATLRLARALQPVPLP
jgi:hypothetical protein